MRRRSPARRRLAALVGLGLALASSVVLAGGIALSPEIGLGSPTSGPAFESQVTPAGAFDGTNYLVAWRSQSPLNPLRPSMIVGTRVAPNGTVLDPVGFPISPFEGSTFEVVGGPAVASDASSSLVVYRASSPTYGASLVGRLVSKAGVPQGAEIVIGSGSCFIGCNIPPRVVFDGTNYVVAWVNETVSVARITPAGVVLDPGGIVLPSGSIGDSGGLLGVTCDPVNCLVSFVPATYTKGGGVRISRAGAIVDTTPIDYGAVPYELSGIPHAVFDGTNHVILAGDHLVRVAPNGTTSPINVSGWVTPRGLAFDGANIHALHGSDRSTLGLHVLVDPTTGAFSGGDATDAKVSYTGGLGSHQQALFCGAAGCLAAWTDDDSKTALGGATDIYVARFGTNGGLQGPARGTNVSLAAETAIGASAAASGTQGLAVFSYDEDDRWDSTLRGPIRASRISTAGGVLDPSGIVVGPPATGASVGAGSNGTDFLVVWAADDLVWARRVSAGGAVLDAAPQQVGGGGGGIRVVWDGADYGIFWRAIKGNGAPDTGGFRRMSPAGTFLDPAPIHLARNAQVACNGTHYLLTWSELNEIRAIRMDKAGNFIEPQPFTVSAAVGSRYAPRVATDGTDFLVAWEDNRNANRAIYGARVTAAGAVVDPTGFPIAESTFGTPASHTIGVMTYSAKRGGYVVGYDKVSNGTKTHLLATVQGTTVADRTEVDVSPTSLAAIGSGPMLGTYERVDLANPFAAVRARARLYDFTGGGASSSSSSTSSSGGTDGGSTTSSSGSSSGGSSTSGSSSGGGSSSTSASSSSGGGSSSGDPGAGGGGEDGGASCSAGGRSSPASVVPALFLGVLRMRRRRRS